MPPPEHATDGVSEPKVDAFRLYFNDLAPHRRFDVDQEHAAAMELRRRRHELYAALLSYPPLAREVLTTLEAHLEAQRSPRAELRKLSRATDAAARRTREFDLMGWRTAQIALAEALVDADHDRMAAAAAMHQVIRGPVGERAKGTGYRTRCEAAWGSLQEARNAFVTANLGLVVSLAQRYRRGHMGFLDLVQEGNAGLLKAVERFDARRGVRFSTYASWWIRHAIGRAITDKEREIRLPAHMSERAQRMARVASLFEQHNGRAPSDHELAAAAGLPLEKVEDLRQIELHKAAAINRDGEPTESIEPDALPAEAIPLEALLDVEKLETHLLEVLDDLPPLQMDVLRRRFGLDGTEPMTLREVGDLHALSRERIRQIQEQALSLLRRRFAQRGLLSA